MRSDISRYSQHGNARLNYPCTRCGILRVGRGRHGDLARVRSENACQLVVGVLVRLCPYGAVKRHCDVGQHGCEVIRYHGVVCGCDGDVARILDGEGVGDRAVFGYHLGGEALCDGESRTHIGVDGVGCGDRLGDACRGDGCGVGDGAFGVGGSELICTCLIDHHSTAACRDSDAADDERRTCSDIGCRLEHTVHEYRGGAADIVKGRQRARAEGIRTEIVRDGHACQRCRTRIPNCDNIGHGVARSVGVGDGGLVGGEHLNDLARHDI